jgi:hypothetical protein
VKRSLLASPHMSAPCVIEGAGKANSEAQTAFLFLILHRPILSDFAHVR